jgi:cellulose biosynthesis protein BcsQ
MAYPTVYGLWTNKGGVGKTTLTYHLATSYAELFPDKIVVAIDMCPQSNLSSTLLTQTTGAPAALHFTHVYTAYTGMPVRHTYAAR